MCIKIEQMWAALRIVMGWIFLWAFLDKLIGLGFATSPDKAWIAGGSPTTGFLTFGVRGPLAPIFQGAAGNPAVDFVFMLALLLLGIALILGVGVKLAAYGGSLLMFLMWLSLLPPENNPIIDEHIVYIFVLLLLYKSGAGQAFGLGKWWTGTKIVKKYKFLE